MKESFEEGKKTTIERNRINYRIGGLQRVFIIDPLESLIIMWQTLAGERGRKVESTYFE